MNSYSDFQNAASSEKLTLVILRGLKKLTGFTAAGANYVLSNFDAILEKVEATGIELTEVDSLSEMAPGCYFNDRVEKKFYIQLAGDKNPNLDFIVSTQKYFFSDKGVTLPFDLAEGDEVYFEPLVKSTSQFGVELDVQNQGMSAIEGGGSITFHNDFDFWVKNFDKIYFENQIVEVFSWSSALRKDQTKRLFRGYVDSKSYGSTDVKLAVKDLLYGIRANVNFKNIEDLGARTDPSLATAKQRLIYGKARGFRPVNIDKLINKSYPLIGKVAVFNAQNIVIGTGTKFKTQVVKNDKIILAGAEYAVAKVLSDVGLELTSNFTGTTAGNLKIEIIPSVNKTYINREWLLSGHSLSQPVFSIQHGSTTQRLVLNTTKDIYDGDDLWIGNYPDGELIQVNKVINSTTLTLNSSTEIVYPNGTAVFRPCVQNVRMNDVKLVFGEDYTVDAIAGTLEISEKAEENRAAVLEANDRITATTGANVFTGIGTKFTSYIKPGDKVRPQGEVEFNQVLTVTDEEITLASDYAGANYVINEPMKQIMSISGLNQFKEQYRLTIVAGFLNQGDYFKLYDANGSVAIWFDLGNLGIEEPEHGCDRSIEITTIFWGDSPATQLKKIKQKLDLDEDAAFTSVIHNNTLTITSNAIGVRPPPKESDIDFLVSNLTRSKQRVKCQPDVADSLHEKMFTIFDSNGSVAVFYDVDNIGVPEPSHECDRSIRISSVVTDDDVTTVRNKTKTALNLDPQFTVTDYGTDSFEVECEMVSVSSGTLPAGYVLERIADGKSLIELAGKHFILPYHDTPTDKLAGFYFDIDAEGIAAPPITVDDLIAITNINSFDLEETFFDKLSASIGAQSYFTSESSENSVVITSEDESEVDSEIDTGDSGLVIEIVQPGASSSPTAGRLLQYKNFVFGENDVLSCDVYGKTVLGDTGSALLKLAPEIVRDLLIMAGSGDFVNESQFSSAKDLFSEELSLVVPSAFSDKATSLSYRDVINSINSSVFGLLLQSNDFELEYSSLRPNSRVDLRLDETDILSYKINSTNKNVLSTVFVEYGAKEYDYLTKSKNFNTVSKNSKTGALILKTANSKTFQCLCVNEIDAKRLANRLSFILENSSNVFSFNTKLQTIQQQVNDIILVSHSKLYHRNSSTKKDRLMMIESIGKSGTEVQINAIDLSAAFNRCAKYTDSEANWNAASDDERLLGGFYKGEDSLIDNDSESHDVNLYW